MKTFAVTAAFAALLTAVPALADPAAAPTPVAPATEAVVAPAMTTVTAAPRAAKPQRFCLIDSITGSHIPVRVCHTRAEWSVRGVDLPDTL
jgi:hypothetical protein